MSSLFFLSRVSLEVVWKENQWEDRERIVTHRDRRTPIFLSLSSSIFPFVFCPSQDPRSWFLFLFIYNLLKEKKTYFRSNGVKNVMLNSAFTTLSLQRYVFTFICGCLIHDFLFSRDDFYCGLFKLVLPWIDCETYAKKFLVYTEPNNLNYWRLVSLQGIIFLPTHSSWVGAIQPQKWRIFFV